MKFDYVTGNPPYQLETTNVSLSNGQLRSKSIFHYFQIEADKIANESTVLIYPAGRWIQRSGKGMAAFGMEQINDHKLSEIYFYPDSKEVFPNAAIADGVSVVVKNMKKDSPGFDYVYCKNGKENHIAMGNPGENIIPLNPQDISISKKLEAFIQGKHLEPLHNRVLPQKLFAIESDFVEKNSACVREMTPSTCDDNDNSDKRQNTAARVIPTAVIIAIIPLRRSAATTAATRTIAKVAVKSLLIVCITSAATAEIAIIVCHGMYLRHSYKGNGLLYRSYSSFALLCSDTRKNLSLLPNSAFCASVDMKLS